MPTTSMSSPSRLERNRFPRTVSPAPYDQHKPGSPLQPEDSPPGLAPGSHALLSPESQKLGSSWTRRYCDTHSQQRRPLLDLYPLSSGALPASAFQGKITRERYVTKSRVGLEMLAKITDKHRTLVVGPVPSQSQTHRDGIPSCWIEAQGSLPEALAERRNRSAAATSTRDSAV